MNTIWKRKSLSAVLIVTLLFSFISPHQVLATDITTSMTTMYNGERVEITAIDSQTISIKSNSENGTIKILNDNYATREISINSSTDGSFKLIYDKINGTIYSTKTGKTIAVPYSSPYVGQRKTVRISYKEIKDEVENAGSVIAIAAVIALYFSGGTVELLQTIATILGGIIGINHFVAEGDPNHGIKITCVYKEWKVTKGGQKYTLRDWKVEKFGTY